MTEDKSPTVEQLFRERYRGKDPQAMRDDHEDFTAIEMLNFAQHCVDKIMFPKGRVNEVDALVDKIWKK